MAHFFKWINNVKTAVNIIWETFENIQATFLIQHLVTLPGGLTKVLHIATNELKTYVST